MKVDKEIYYSLFLIAIATLPLLAFHHKNKYKNMERYYYNNNKMMYIALQLSYYILALATVINARYIFFYYAKSYMKKYIASFQTSENICYYINGQCKHN